MKVVFDTDIYISALLLPGSQAEKAIVKVLDAQDVLLISRPPIDEVLTVLGRKFSRDREELSRVAILLNDLAQLVKPLHRILVLRDEPDNRVLECAVAGIAQCIVTGDEAMLALREYEGIRIISLRDYLST